MKLLKVVAALATGAAIGVVALTLYARKKVQAFIDNPDGDVSEDEAMQSGAVMAVGEAFADTIGYHRRQVAEALGIPVARDAE